MNFDEMCFVCFQVKTFGLFGCSQDLVTKKVMYDLCNVVFIASVCLAGTKTEVLVQYAMSGCAFSHFAL